MDFDFTPPKGLKITPNDKKREREERKKRRRKKRLIFFGDGNS